MKKFLLTGNLGGIYIGMPVKSARLLLGSREDKGCNLTRGWSLEAYADKALQVSYYQEVVGLIGLYFDPKNAEPPTLPPNLNCTVPFHGLTTINEVKNYLNENNIPWEMNTLLEGTVCIKIGAGISVYFEEGLLSSLLISER